MHTFRHESGVNINYNSDCSGAAFMVIPVSVATVARIESQTEEEEDYWEVELPCAALADFINSRHAKEGNSS